MPRSSQLAICGALPSRIARWSTGRARPSISRKMIPGASVCVVPPWRRAIRRITRSEYVSSSFAPKITSSTSIDAEITTDASSAQPNESTLIVLVVMCDASSSMTASSTSTSTKPSASVNGSRSAATTGGSTAFSAAISTAAASASAKLPTLTCGTIAAAMNTDTPATSHDTSTFSRRKRGACGLHVTACPYESCVCIDPMRISPPAARLASPRTEDGRGMLHPHRVMDRAGGFWHDRRLWLQLRGQPDPPPSLI